MYRRRRRVREIPFSFDSFLDVVANVVGIIIRLILVVWVGARSYSSMQHLMLRLSTPVSSSDTAPPEPSDPLQDQLARDRQELALAKASLLHQLRLLQGAEEQERQMAAQQTALVARHRELEQMSGRLDEATQTKRKSESELSLSLEELRNRQRKLLEDLRALENAPASKQALHYRTPVSRPVQAEEFFFECQQGRVSFIDVSALIAEVRQSSEERSQLLRSQWQVSDAVPPVGAFRLRYTLERERGLVDALGSQGKPEGSAGFRYGLSEWIVEPVALVRGETVAEALHPGSEFRRIADRLDPQQAVVTFWVYPDSFAAYRQLRDYLYEKDVVVAGRPLPGGMPIICSRHGSLSRAQ